MTSRRFPRRHTSSPLPATLALDFIGRGDTLDPRITFSRTTNATLTDSTGALVYAPHNLLVQSESVDNAIWPKQNVTVTANAAVAPDNATTADKVVASTLNAEHYTEQAFAASAGFVYVVSAHVKADGITSVVLRFTVGSLWSGGASPQVAFDLTNQASTVNAGSPLNYGITDAGNGFFRVYMSVLCTTAGTSAARVHLASSGSISFAGDGTSGIFLWGAQLNISTLQPYNPTTVKNLLGFTQEFNNAAWTKTNSTITANATAAPDGSVTADALVASGTSFARVQQNVAMGAGVYTLSVYAKANTSSFLGGTVEIAGQVLRIYANLSTGATTQTTDAGTISATSSSTDVGNGWWRFRWTITTPSAATYVVYFAVTDSFGSFSVTVGRAIFIWGAQLSDSASLDPYVYNPAAAPASTAYYGPRFDYDPVTLAARGLLVEEQRTNSIRNNTMVGAVAGTPGTLPTNWTANTPSNGLNRELVGAGVEAGIQYVDVRYSGTTSSTSLTAIYFEGATQVAALSGQSWTNSAYVSLAGGSATNVTALVIGIDENSNVGGFLAGSSTAFTPSSGALSGKRFSHSRTLNNASTAFVRPYVFFTYSSGAAIDITLRIGLPQLELGAFSTSVILTSTAAATRAADVATMVGDNFANWYRQDEGTLFAEYTPSAVGPATTAQFILAASDGTTSNTLLLFKRANADVSTRYNVNTGGVNQVFSNLGTFTAATNKATIAYKLDDFAGVLNAGSVVADTNGTVPTLTQTYLGSDVGAGTQLNGHLRRVSFFPRRLAGSELQAITQ
jgi:hypothetical protein